MRGPTLIFFAFCQASFHLVEQKQFIHDLPKRSGFGHFLDSIQDKFSIAHIDKTMPFKKSERKLNFALSNFNLNVSC